MSVWKNVFFWGYILKNIRKRVLLETKKRSEGEEAKEVKLIHVMFHPSSRASVSSYTDVGQE